MWQQARVCRLRGELHEQAGEIARPVKVHDDALTIDPKWGVARRAARLRKALATAQAKPGANDLRRPD